MTITPTLPSVGCGTRRRGLGGCLLGAGLLLIASAQPGCAGVAAPGLLAVPVAQVRPAAQVQDPGRRAPAGAPSAAAPAANTLDPASAVGFGWG